MHMADALVSPAVAIVAGAAAVTLTAISAKKITNSTRQDLMPMMGVLGAFVFAAQMINFSIPGTGSSGHIIGGILLASILGPWAALLTLTSVLVIQCLVFADGGLMALGCNILNMAVTSCLIAFPFVFKPIAGRSDNKWRLMSASVVASIVGLELGACLVTAETELSGVTALSTGRFLGLMTSIHLAIGLVEGLATGAVLWFVASCKPDMLYLRSRREAEKSNAKHRMSRRTRTVLGVLGGAALILAAGFTWLASENPDGLEWSIQRITGATELGAAMIPATAVLPDYNSTFSGIIGGVIVMVTLWCICMVLFRHRHKTA